MKDISSLNPIMGGVLFITAGATAIAQVTAPHRGVRIFTAAITSRAIIITGQHGHRATTDRAGLATEAGNGQPGLLSFKLRKLRIKNPQLLCRLSCGLAGTPIESGIGSHRV
jgi:hypothetical protein